MYGRGNQGKVSCCSITLVESYRGEASESLLAVTAFVDTVSTIDTGIAGAFRLTTETPPSFWSTATAEVGRQPAANPG
jgi:hypothetical protein